MQCVKNNLVTYGEKPYPVRDKSLVEKISRAIPLHPVGMRLVKQMLHTYGML